MNEPMESAAELHLTDEMNNLDRESNIPSNMLERRKHA